MKSKISATAKEKSKVTKEEWREYTKTVWHIANVTHPGHPAVFPIEIPKRLIKLFSFVGETVFDPFGGTGSTAKAALPLDRKAVCIDQNQDYVSIMEEECVPLIPKRAGKDRLQIIHGDSRSVPLKDDSVGLVVTSPPYWNKADYGGNGSNLGSEDHYSRFLDLMRPVYEECFRVLAPGRKLCIVTANVNQHTSEGLLTFPLAADFIVMCRRLGFVLVNEVIWSKDGTGGKWGSANGQRPIFGSYPYPPNFLFKNVHEHIIILAKPPSKKSSGKKALPYQSLLDAELTSFLPINKRVDVD